MSYLKDAISLTNHEQWSLEQAVDEALKLKERFGQDVVDLVLDQYVLDKEGFHGPHHWERVLLNGLTLHSLLPTHINKDAIFLFALFHDCKRENEGLDLLHGERGGNFFYDTVDKDFKLPSDIEGPEITKVVRDTFIACREHTNVLFNRDPTIAACFDADRLDLMRVGIYPDITKLNYQSTISDTLIYECSVRADKKYNLGVFTK